ncbi:hypothetical protein ACPA0O_19890 [Ectopseudomonas chengduensis]|uniref:hypothetical protein n=1 Tax=Pseudomonas sp. Marseille-Q0931 TaxID=2697507 RepID=UPI001476534D|nr:MULTISPECIES: hypothetical protein [unclassified Pseudomonas]NMY17088.1 hypothetical protein [Pseudomonas sp. WS 5019]
MTFRAESFFDLTHTCPTKHAHSDHSADLDSRTWTCRTCQQSVYIEMADKDGNHFIVERVPAREIRAGDFIVYRERAGITAGEVTGSNAYHGKGRLWYLAVAQFGHDKISPEQYISRIPT